MTSVLEGLLPTRRRRSRSRSESGKQLHARWGDNAITAPNGSGWSQQYLEEDQIHAAYQAHGSPDSQKTLVNNSPELGHDSIRTKIENILQAVEDQKFAGVPVIKEVDGQITITFSLGPSAQQPQQSHQQRRPSAENIYPSYTYPTPAQSERAPNTETRHLFPPISTNIDEVITVEARDLVDPYRTTSPIVHTQSPVYDDVSTFFTRAAFPEKSFGPVRLPHIQTNVPQNKSQPASAISVSVLSPVQEKYNELSESTGNTPLDNTPIAARIAASIPRAPSIADELADLETLTQRLEKFRDPASSPPSRITSPIDTSDSDFDNPFPRSRGPSRSASRGPGISRPSSRGPGIGEVAYMRASSRGPADQPRSESRSGMEGRRSASRETSRRAQSVEPVLRSHSVEPIKRAMSREPAHRRSESRGGDDDDRRPSRSRSRNPKPRRSESVGDQNYRRADSVERSFRHVEILDPAADRGPRDATPIGYARSMTSATAYHKRAMSRDQFDLGRRTASPSATSRRAASRGAGDKRRLSGDFSRRAVSVDPIRRHATPQEDFTPISRRGTPLAFQNGRFVPLENPASDSSADEHDPDRSPTSGDDTGIDTDATDIETETDDAYYESRKEWNGRAANGADGKGYYGDVANEYKAIAKDVEADQAAVTAGGKIEKQVGGINIGGLKLNITKVTMDKSDKERDKEWKKNNTVKKHYAGPDLVPSEEEVWG
ncbi:uncharacterized protein A1O9_01042 [Exophiala aquamarina CBS 119918]|uniref:Uncharacterized protein n=1 Tax=Exophiala aquamarina CBS 119918 TaxID=1182545 RepID=A0A072PT61_9EURO|nr:uncharacterized protein A1O9_01042 [Exophiala aquamarina CBS 119918]KEF63066.1 hypothetical protein A1O9_01042 [Exophiala aquamarina CBS 119918]